MSSVLNIFTLLAVVTGGFFFLAGTVGLLRFPDTLSRLHALTKADNLGLGLIVLGLLAQAGSFMVGLKLIIVWLLVLIASATASQLIACKVRAGLSQIMNGALNIALAALILGLAVWSVLTREMLAAIIGFVAYGLLLTLVWVQLQGIDVALTEAAIGGGLTGILLFGAAARLRGSAAAADAEPAPAGVRWLAASVSAAVSAGLIICVFSLPDPAPTLAPAVAANIAVTEVGNPITAVLLAFRAMDTLLEAIVLLFALIGVWSLAADRVWGGRPGPQPFGDPNGMLTYAARILPPLGLMIGAYIFWVGADYPGGKFQGATLLAAMWLLILLAGLTDAPRISRPVLRIGLIVGPLAFIVIGLTGVLTAGSVLAYPDGFAKPLIVTIELALLPSLTLVLGLLLLGTPERSDEQ